MSPKWIFIKHNPPPASGTSSVLSLWKASNTNPTPPASATYLQDSAVWSISNGSMTLSINFSAQNPTGHNAGNGIYYLEIPGVVINQNLVSNSILATGTGFHGTATFPVQIRVLGLSSGKKLGLYIPAYDNTWWQHWFGSYFFNGKMGLNITVTVGVQ